MNFSFQYFVKIEYFKNLKIPIKAWGSNWKWLKLQNIIKSENILYSHFLSLIPTGAAGIDIDTSYERSFNNTRFYENFSHWEGPPYPFIQECSPKFTVTF